jgi:hypothetical protein
VRGSLTKYVLVAGMLMATVGPARADGDDHWHKGWHRGWGYGPPPPAYYRPPRAYYAPPPPPVYYVPPPPPPVVYGTPGISVTIPLH